MSKPATRLSLADRLAAVAGPQISPSAIIQKEAEPASRVQTPKASPTPRIVSPSTVEPVAASPTAVTSPARVGKTMIAGYFTPQMAKAVKLLAVERDTTVQALIGEGLDAVLHKYGKHPMGER
jgi:hypothetical protein